LVTTAIKAKEQLPPLPVRTPKASRAAHAVPAFSTAIAVGPISQEDLAYTRRKTIARATQPAPIITEDEPIKLTRLQQEYVAMFDSLPPARTPQIPWESAGSSQEMPQEAKQDDPDNTATIQLPIAELRNTPAEPTAARAPRHVPSWAQQTSEGASPKRRLKRQNSERTETALGSVGTEAPSRRRGAHAKPKEQKESGLLVTWKRVLTRKFRNLFSN